ncbi:MAG: extracellular solute-binding protein [Spirochaetales bacterium]|nr:extracellular solute-binding protein [Spirochaetales bacterium]
MKKLIIITLAFFLVIGFSAFAGGKQEAVSKDWTKAKLTMHVEAMGWILKKFPVEVSAEKFMSAHPNVTIKVSSNADNSLNNYMLNWSAGNVDVDLAFGGAAVQVAKLAFKGLLMPWNDFYKGDFTRDHFLTHVVELTKRGNDYYALPFMVEAMSLEANRKLLVEAGLGTKSSPAKPKTLDDLYNFAKKTTKGSGSVKDIYGFSWNFTNFGDQQLFCAINDLGGKAYNADGSPNMKAPEIAKVFSFIKKVTMDGYGTKGTITDTNAGRSGLKAGSVAIIFEAASRAIEAKPALGDDAILLPFPGEEQNGSYIYSHYCYVPKETKVKDAVWAFVREQVLSKDFSKFGAEKYGKLPSLKRNFEGLSADFSEVQKWMSNPKTVGDHPWVEGSKLNSNIWEIEQELVSTNITGQQAADKLAKIAAGLNLSVVK